MADNVEIVSPKGVVKKRTEKYVNSPQPIPVTITEKLLMFLFLPF